MIQDQIQMSKAKITTKYSKRLMFFKSWRSTILVGFGILVSALFLRIYNLTTLPIFGDEAIYIRWSQVMNVVPSLRFLPLSDGKQPGFMWVLMFLVNRFSDPLFVGRLTSVFYGMGTFVGIFVFTYYLFRSRKLALIASLFWAISPYAVFFDRLALVDSMLAMFGVWTLIFGAITAKTLRLDFAMLTGFALGGALLTKSPAIFFVILLPSTWMLSKWPNREKKQRAGMPEFIHLSKLVLLYAVTLVIAYGMYNILRLGENFHLVSSRNLDYVYPVSHLWTNPLNPLVSHLNEIYDWLWRMGPSVLVVFVLLSLIAQIKRVGVKFGLKKMKRPSSEVALLFVWSIIPLVATCLYAKVFTTRYIFFSLPVIYIFASLIFYYLYSKKELLKKVLIFGLILYIIQSLQINHQLLTNPEDAPLPRVMRSGYLEEWTAGIGIKQVADYIRSEYHKEPDKKIIVGTEGYFGTLPDGLQIYLNDLPDITVIGTGLDFKEVPQSLIESKQAGNKTYFVVNSSRMAVDYQELNLQLIDSYEKVAKPNGSRESLYFFEVIDATINDL